MKEPQPYAFLNICSKIKAGKRDGLVESKNIWIGIISNRDVPEMRKQQLGSSEETCSKEGAGVFMP